jgi:hypothetical protein
MNASLPAAHELENALLNVCDKFNGLLYSLRKPQETISRLRKLNEVFRTDENMSVENIRNCDILMEDFAKIKNKAEEIRQCMKEESIWLECEEVKF